MKLQCPCGAKFAFDVTPEMARDPVRFSCPECNVDLSGPINDLIRQELGLVPAAAAAAPVRIATAMPVPVAAPAVSIPAAAPRPAAAAPAALGKLSIARAASTATHGSAVEAAPQHGASTEAGQPCPKHQGEFIVEHCYVCRKPLCPKCMELFGYVCSPLCKAKAESHGINVPLYANQKSVVEARQWRKIALIGWSVGLGVAGLIGFWGWYAFYGSRPHSIFSARFPEMSYAGSSQLCGQKQIVFLHGGTLARYALGGKKPVWSDDLITQQQLNDALAQEKKEFQAEQAEAIRMGEDRPRVRDEGEQMLGIQKEMEASLTLFVDGQNIWVTRNGKMTRYDWDTGKAGQEVAMPNTFAEPKLEDGELLFTQENAFGQHVITHFSLASGETHTEQIGEPVGSAVLAEANKSAAHAGKKGTDTTGLPTRPGGPDSGKALDPNKVAHDAQKLPYAAKVALPATLGNTMHQEQVLKEIKNDEADGMDPTTGDALSRFGRSFIRSKYGYTEWSSKLLEEHMVSHSAMKAPPARSVLDNNPTVGNSLAGANEILNQMQRDRGGDVVIEDQSRYQVTVHRPDVKDVPDWTGEVIGPPRVIEQKTITIVAGGSMFVVLDKSNKKLWQGDLTHQINGGSVFDEDDPSETSLGEGPCVEHDDSLYVFDEATLTAFDRASGNVRWRVPSIGITGIFFDGQGGMYVNSTTADLDSLKYSRQIDITKKTSVSVLKVNCKTGKVLWSVEPGGAVSHVDGEYVLCYTAHQGADLDPDALTTLPGMNDSSMHITRLSPKSGKAMWNYSQPRAPFYVRFHGNVIELVFRKEVQVLKFISL